MPDDPNRPNGRNGEHPDDGDDVILSEQTAAPGARAASPPTTLTPHDLATPYVLDALEIDEREAFERHLANCHACQVRVADLEEAALLLPDAMVTPPADLPDAFPYLLRDVAHETLLLVADPLPDEGDEPEPEEPGITPGEADEPESGFTPAEPETPDAEPELEPEPEAVAESVEEEAVAEPVPAEIPAPVEKRSKSKKSPKQAPAPVAAEEIAQPVRPARPPGRIRPGVRVPPPNGAGAGGGSARDFQLTPTTVAALALGLVALGLFLWSLLLLGRVGDLESEIDQQNEEITALRQQANATAYTLTPTTNGPAGASGTFFFSLPDQQGALVVRGLNAAPNGWAYQLWFIDDDETAPTPGPLFQVDENGEALVPLLAEVSTFDAVAISLEPAGGSPAPTSQVILQGRLGGAAG
ncbi:MAG: anti-sigma factor [Thermomicrobiales bacterium]|nr:anti-sigma factor [Thermomicrobiales bacterium]